MKIHVINRQKSLPLKKKWVRAIVSSFLDLEKQVVDEVSIAFVSKKEISQLHGKYFKDPTPTDCISFPIDPHPHKGYRLLGEVVVCPHIAKDYAEKHQKDPYKEVALYIIHGLLHLIGHDDLEPKDRKQMRAAERRHLKCLYP